MKYLNEASKRGVHGGQQKNGRPDKFQPTSASGWTLRGGRSRGAGRRGEGSYQPRLLGSGGTTARWGAGPCRSSLHLGKSFCHGRSGRSAFHSGRRGSGTWVCLRFQLWGLVPCEREAASWCLNLHRLWVYVSSLQCRVPWAVRSMVATWCSYFHHAQRAPSDEGLAGEVAACRRRVVHPGRAVQHMWIFTSANATHLNPPQKRGPGLPSSPSRSWVYPRPWWYFELPGRWPKRTAAVSAVLIF